MTSIGIFAAILCMFSNGHMVEDIDSLSGLSKTKPAMAFAFAIFMFSMAGIPPMGGFIGKFYIFKSAIDAGLMILAIIGLVTSVISSYYYLRIVKVIYFNEPIQEFSQNRIEMNLIMSVSTAFTLIFILFPNMLIHITDSIC